MEKRTQQGKLTNLEIAGVSDPYDADRRRDRNFR